MLAIRLGGSGDMTDKAIRWKYQRSVPQLPSPLLFGGVLYMVNDNGIITTLNPETGELHQAGPADRRAGTALRVADRRGWPHLLHERARRVVVVTPGGDLTPMAVNDLGEDTYATPAFADGRIYVRTSAALYAFGKP